MLVLPSPKYVPSRNLIWNWGDDHWVDPGTQLTDCELEVGSEVKSLSHVQLFATHGL